MAQDVIIREEDCGTDRGLEIQAIREGNEIIESLEDRLVDVTPVKKYVILKQMN